MARDGAAALTMRALAAEAGCAVGLPYKIFASRAELVAELVHAEFVRLRAAFDALVADAGTGTVGDNLGRFAELLLDSPAVGLAHDLPHDVPHDETLTQDINERAGETGVVTAVTTTVTDYLAAEKRLGRVEPGLDEQAFGFLISGAVHNLLVSGDPYPKPSLPELKRLLAAVAAQIAPDPHKEETDADIP